jgi:hypothetical protein
MFVDVVESMGSLKPGAPPRVRFAGVWRSLARRAARTRDDERYERWTLSERELGSLQKLRDARAVKAQDRKTARDAVRETHERRRAAEREAQQHARAEQLAGKQAEKARRLAEKRARVDAERAARQRAG